MLKDVIEGKHVLTINMAAEDIYPIEYDNIATANIINYTDGVIYVSEENNFELKNNIGEYLTITDGNAYNDYIFYKSGLNKLYIKADAAGYVCIVRKQW